MLASYDKKVRHRPDFADYPYPTFTHRTAVIMNEHLMEALRRLRRSSSDTNVDRRLVTNVLLSFLTTPRADSKRFEMLSLLSTILQWTDDEREKAGLQRSAASQPLSGGSLWGRSGASAPAAKPAELQKTDETEVSRLPALVLLLSTTTNPPAVVLPPMGRVPPHRSLRRRKWPPTAPALALTAAKRLAAHHPNAGVDSPVARGAQRHAPAALVHVGGDGELARAQAREPAAQGQGARAVVSQPVLFEGGDGI